MMKRFDLVQEKILFNERFVIEEATLRDEEGFEFSRLRLKRENASAVLVYNSDSNKIILVRQFRYPIASQSSETICEIVAGKIDPGESPLNAALRETEEETGYRIPEGGILLLNSCFASPGYSSERFFIYFAKVGNSDKIAPGGGLPSENEDIEVVKISLDDFKKKIYEGGICDAKTSIAAFYAIHRGLI